MTNTPATLTARLLDAAAKAGAESADALAVSGTSVSIDVRGGALEHAERSEGVDIGLRVFVGQRSAVVSASDTSDATIAQMAERAVAMANEAPNDPFAGLAAPDQLAQAWDVAALDLLDPAPEPSPDTLRDLAAEAEAVALATPGVTQVQGAAGSYGQTEFHLATSNGFSGGYGRTSHGLYCTAISGTGTGMERDHDGDHRTHFSDMRSAADIGRSAGERAAALQNARRAQTGTWPVLFDERISSSLIGHLLQAINGAAVTRGSSWLLDAVGDTVLPPALSLVENPHRPRVGGSRPFDGEGLPTAPRDIVRDGVLAGYTLDLASARKLGMAPTGNAARGVSGPPNPSVGNVTLTPGAATHDDLLSQMGTGLLVTSLIGSTINPNTGDYSRGASGFWVENGEITHPVNEITIAGNLRDMLGRIIPANDARGHLSRVIPSLLVEGMSLAGD